MIEGQHIARVGLSKAGRRIHEDGMAFLRANPSEAVAPPVPKYIERAEKDRPAMTPDSKASRLAARERMRREIPSQAADIIAAFSDRYGVTDDVMLSKDRGHGGELVFARSSLIGRIALETSMSGEHIAAIFNRSPTSIRKTVVSYSKRMRLAAPPATRQPTPDEIKADEERARGLVEKFAGELGLSFDEFTSMDQSTPMHKIRREVWYRCATETTISFIIISRASKRGHNAVVRGVRQHCKYNDLPLPRGLAAS